MAATDAACREFTILCRKPKLLIKSTMAISNNNLKQNAVMAYENNSNLSQSNNFQLFARKLHPLLRSLFQQF
jgi:hypothetical protein